jgi:hypothetical protein
MIGENSMRNILLAGAAMLATTGMAMAVVSVGLTTLCLLLLQHMEQKRKGVA